MSAKVTTSLGETRREMWIGLNWLGCSSPAAAVSSASSCTVARWKLATRSILSGTTSARWRVGSWVATPVGQRSVWQCCDWMQPTREHEAARGVAPVGAQRHGAHDVEGGDDLAGGAELDAVAHADADQRVVHEVAGPARIGLPIWSMNSMRRGAGAALLAVDDDEVGIDAGLQHRLADRQELPFVADAELEAGRLAARQRGAARR